MSKRNNQFAISFINTIVRMGCSLLQSFLVPKFFGDNFAEYGFYQLYCLYLGYLGVFQFGWIEGLYVRNGGKKIDQLDAGVYSAHFRMICAMELVISLVLLVGIQFATCEVSYQYVYKLIALSIAPVILRTYFSYTVQAVGKIKQYVLIEQSNTLVNTLLILGLFFIGKRNANLFIMIKLASVVFSGLVGCFLLKDLIFAKPASFKRAMSEAKADLRCGFPLTVSGMTTILISNAAKIVIELRWDIVTFSKMSIAFSLSTLMTNITEAFSIVFYPILKNTKNELLAPTYKKLRFILSVCSFGAMTMFVPLLSVVKLWLPQYAESLSYSMYLMPICVFAIRMSSLVQLYIRVLNLGTKLFRVTAISLLVTIASVAVSAYIFSSIQLTMITFMICQMIQCSTLECVIGRMLKISLRKDTLLDCGMIMLFIAINYGFTNMYSFICYMACFFLYCLIKRKELKEIILNIKCHYTERKN